MKLLKKINMMLCAMQEDLFDGNLATYWCATEIHGTLGITPDGTSFRPAEVMLQDSGANLLAINVDYYATDFAHLPLEDWPQKIGLSQMSKSVMVL